MRGEEECEEEAWAVCAVSQTRPKCVPCSLSNSSALARVSTNRGPSMPATHFRRNGAQVRSRSTAAFSSGELGRRGLRSPGKRCVPVSAGAHSLGRSNSRRDSAAS